MIVVYDVESKIEGWLIMPYANDLSYVTKKNSVFQLLSPYFVVFVFSVSTFYKTKTTTVWKICHYKKIE